MAQIYTVQNEETGALVRVVVGSGTPDAGAPPDPTLPTPVSVSAEFPSGLSPSDIAEIRQFLVNYADRGGSTPRPGRDRDLVETETDVPDLARATDTGSRRSGWVVGEPVAGDGQRVRQDPEATKANRKAPAGPKKTTATKGNGGAKTEPADNVTVTETGDGTRTYRKAPSDPELLAAYKKARGSIAQLMEAFNAPRHTVRGWLERARTRIDFPDYKQATSGT